MSALRRWVRAAARRNALSRSRCTRASSKRSSLESRSIRRCSTSTTSSGSRSRLSRRERTTAAYDVRSTLPSHGERQRPISASTQGEREGCLREVVGALPHGERLVEGRQALLRGLAGGERPEVVGLVVEDATHQRESWPDLAGELEEVHLLGKPRPAVVARLVLGDEAELADLRLEGGRAHDAVDGGGDADHLTHPGAGLRGGEVGAHAAAQVAGGADVEDPALLVAEEVDPGRVGEPFREVALATLRRAHPRGEGLQLLQGVDAQPAEPLHQAVQDVDGRAGVGEGSVVRRRAGLEDAGERRQLAVGRVVARHDPARQPCGVDHLERRPRPALLEGEVPQEADVERRVVGDQHRAGGELEERREGRLDRGRVGHHRVGDAGQDGDERRDRGVRVDQGLELAEDLAAADLHRADLGDHRAGFGRPAGGLEVDDAERDVAQRPAELVEAALRLPLGGGRRGSYSSCPSTVGAATDTRRTPRGSRSLD